MLYRVFSNEAEVGFANARWLEARSVAGVVDRRLGSPVNPQITNAWDSGRVMLDGRIACTIPPMFASEFGGLELDLGEEDFPLFDDEH